MANVDQKVLEKFLNTELTFTFPKKVPQIGGTAMSLGTIADIINRFGATNAAKIFQYGAQKKPGDSFGKVKQEGEKLLAHAKKIQDELGQGIIYFRGDRGESVTLSPEEALVREAIKALLRKSGLKIHEYQNFFRESRVVSWKDCFAGFLAANGRDEDRVKIGIQILNDAIEQMRPLFNLKEL